MYFSISSFMRGVETNLRYSKVFIKNQHDIYTYSFFLLGAALSVIVLAADLASSSTGYFTVNGLRFAFYLQCLYTTGFILHLYMRKKLNMHILTTTVIYLGAALRICYMLYTGPGTRTYDVYRDHWGHLDYIRHIATNLALPPVNECQAYHPPVHHVLSAAALVLGRLLFHNEFLQLKVVQALAALLNILSLVIIRKILAGAGCSPAAVLAGVSLIAFHPTHIYFASRINNDNALFLFYTLAFYAILQWLSRQSTFMTFKMAFFTSLAILTKFSGIMLLPLIAAAFFFVYLQNRSRYPLLIKQLTLFGITCVPLAASYSLRNYILFGQVPGYVPSFGKAFTPSIGNLLSIPAGNMLTSPFNNGGLVGGEFFLEFLLKSSLFGEWKYPGLEIPAFLLLFSTVLLSVILSLLILLNWRKVLSGFGFLFLLNLLVPLLLEVKFRTDFPVACSQDFRYIAPILISIACLLGKATTGTLPGCNKAAKNVMVVFLALFCIFSAGFVLLLANFG
jgi:hypothetical protein